MSQLAAYADTAAPLNIDLIWGITAIAREIGRSNRQTYHMVESGTLPVKRVGHRFVANRAELRKFFAEMTPAQRGEHV